jgi:hypothetical protein
VVRIKFDKDEEQSLETEEEEDEAIGLGGETSQEEALMRIPPIFDKALKH